MFKLGQPTAHPDIRYVIVSRPLVLLAWLEEGRCASVKEISDRFRSAVTDSLGLVGQKLTQKGADAAPAWLVSDDILS